MAMTTIRQWHSYIGLFTAPTVLFFSLTGAVQLYSLHEAHGSYRPPALIEKLSSVHKDQAFEFGDHHPKDVESDGESSTDDAPPPPDADDSAGKTALTTWLLKAFFLIVALGLSLSTVFGVWMGLTQIRQRLISVGLLIAGTVIPIILLVV